MSNQPSNVVEDADRTAARLRSAMLGASVRGDREALDGAICEAADRCRVSEEHALAAWVRKLFTESHSNDGLEESFITVELQKLPRETLASIAFQLARILYTDSTPPSRAS